MSRGILQRSLHRAQDPSPPLNRTHTQPTQTHRTTTTPRLVGARGETRHRQRSQRSGNRIAGRLTTKVDPRRRRSNGTSLPWRPKRTTTTTCPQTAPWPPSSLPANGAGTARTKLPGLIRLPRRPTSHASAKLSSRPKRLPKRPSDRGVTTPTTTCRTRHLFRRRKASVVMASLPELGGVCYGISSDLGGISSDAKG
jgi:hypothetical protein